MRTAALAEGAVLSHSYIPVLTSTPFTDGKGQSRGNFGGTELCLAHKPLTNGDATNHTQQQCGITHRPSEKTDDLKQLVPHSKGIFKMWQNCQSEHVFDRSTFC